LENCFNVSPSATARPFGICGSAAASFSLQNPSAIGGIILFAPLGLDRFPAFFPGLAPWALLLRRFAAFNCDSFLFD
jgi:hypothetical protein